MHSPERRQGGTAAVLHRRPNRPGRARVRLKGGEAPRVVVRQRRYAVGLTTSGSLLGKKMAKRCHLVAGWVTLVAISVTVLMPAGPAGVAGALAAFYLVHEVALGC